MIIFLEAPGFYAAVEQADYAELRGRPVIVGGDPHKHGTVTAVSREARSRGLEEGMEVCAALERVPEAACRATRLRRYREASAQIGAVLRGVSDRIETQGLAAFFVQPPDRADAVRVAAELCVRIRAELLFDMTAGIGPTRFVAQLAARTNTRAGVREITADEVESFLAPLPVHWIWGLGPSTASLLAEQGIEHIADLQHCSEERLEDLVGRVATGFLSLARGGESEPLHRLARPKSLSRERTLAEPVHDLRILGDELGVLASQVQMLLAREHCAARTVSLSVAFVDGGKVTRTQTVSRPLRQQNEILEAAFTLLNRTQAGVRSCRRLRLQVSKLSRGDMESEARQLPLF